MYRQILKKVFSFFFLVAPGKPTDLRVASVRDLKIMLKWKRPLTTAGAPDSSVLSYMVSYQVVGSGPGRRVPATSESAELDLQDNKQYNIYVKAVRPNQSTWSDVFGLHTNTLGEFGLVFSPSKESFLKAAISMDKTLHGYFVGERPIYMALHLTSEFIKHDDNVLSGNIVNFETREETAILSVLRD